MDEYNPLNYSIEPEEEPNGGEYNPFDHISQPEKPKKEKKNRNGLKLIVLVAVVAVLGSIGGSLLTGFIGDLKGDYVTEEAAPAPVEQEGHYDMVVHKLPEQLVSNDAGKGLSPVEIYEMTVHSVVGIKTEATVNVFGQEAVSASAGTGFILSEDGYVITNCHVVDGADTIEVKLFNEESYKAELVGKDSSYDIAVLKIEAEGLSPVTVGDSDALKVGEEVAVIGNPLGELTFTMTTGILSALDREINTDGNPQNMLQTNAAINSGNSGGPLFDMDGNVIGVTSAKFSGTSSSGATIEGLGFAIPINTALKVAYDLVDHGYVRGQAYLGVEVSTLNAKTAAYYGLPAGPRVETVIEDSAAQKAGLQVGDIITAINDVKTTTYPEMLAVLKKHKAGETVELKIYRAGAEMTLTAVLDEKPQPEEEEAKTEAQQKQPQVQPQQPQVIDPFEYFFSDPYGFGSGN